MAYQFSPADTQLVIELLDRASTSAEDPMMAWHSLWGNAEFQSLRSDLRAEIDFLFVYELQENYEKAGVIRLVESELTLTKTRSKKNTPSDAWTLWSEVLADLQGPMLKAHIADSLLTARVKTDPEHAAFTIKLYLETAGITTISAHHVAISLARANTIARSRGMVEEITVRNAMHSKSVVLSGTALTGAPALTLLSALSVPPSGGEYDSGERELIRDRVLGLGGSSFAFVDEVGKILVRLAENEPVLEAARRWHVNQYLSLAETDDHGMRKMHYAQTAADLATDHGFQDLREKAILIMQTIDRDSMGWKTADTEIPISKNAFRAHLRKFRHARDWRWAVMIFLAGRAPSGNHQKNIKRTKDSARESIRSLVRRTTYGIHGLPERTNADFMEEEVARTEITTLNMSAIFLALELEFIRERFSTPCAAEVADWLMAELSADMTVAKHFSESLILHWNGQFSDSARLSIPLIESAARNLLLAIDEPLYRTQRGEAPGRFPAMDFYVDALSRRGLDPDWRRSLEMTLLSSGMNLRNLAAHGFLMDFSPEQSALLLRLSGLFCSMPTGIRQSHLECPPKAARRRLRRRLGWVWL